MTSLTFRCFKCGQMSDMRLRAQQRDEVSRLVADSNPSYEMTLYCSQCGKANEITLTAEMLTALVTRLDSNDPQIQKAIDDAKRGNYNTAINEALRRFKF